jgi:hypothetical protein
MSVPPERALNAEKGQLQLRDEFDSGSTAQHRDVHGRIRLVT